MGLAQELGDVGLYVQATARHLPFHPEVLAHHLDAGRDRRTVDFLRHVPEDPADPVLVKAQSHRQVGPFPPGFQAGSRAEEPGSGTGESVSGLHGFLNVRLQSQLGGFNPPPARAMRQGQLLRQLGLHRSAHFRAGRRGR